TVDLSYVSASVSGASNVGGISGWNEGGIISNSYVTGAVSASVNRVGGLVGYNDGVVGQNGIVQTSYASGLVSGGAADQGGVAGENTNSGQILGTYYDTFTTNQGSAFGADDNGQADNAVTGDWSIAEDAYNQASYEVAGQEFDFINTWFIAEGSSRP